MAARFQPLDPDFLNDPYPSYRELREKSPVHRIRFGWWMIAQLTWRATRARMKESGEGFWTTLGTMRREDRRRRSVTGQGAARPRFYAVARHAECQDVLRRAAVFQSGRGLSLNDEVNRFLIGSTLNSDGDAHRRRRSITATPILPKTR